MVHLLFAENGTLANSHLDPSYRFSKAPPPLKKLLQIFFVTLGCLHLVGGPHSVIQLYAWANMLVTYSQDSTLTQAAKDTFSGEKPCHLCVKIEASKSADTENEKETPLLTAASKLFQDLFPPTLASLRDPFSSPFPQPTFPASADLLSPPASGPPVPPPRC